MGRHREQSHQGRTPHRHTSACFLYTVLLSQQCGVAFHLTPLSPFLLLSVAQYGSLHTWFHLEAVLLQTLPRLLPVLLCNRISQVEEPSAHNPRILYLPCLLLPLQTCLAHLATPSPPPVAWVLVAVMLIAGWLMRY